MKKQEKKLLFGSINYKIMLFGIFFMIVGFFLMSGGGSNDPNIFSDVNGEYRGFDQQVHNITDKQTAQYANFSGWDVYRSQLQLVSLTHPQVASDIAQSLFNQANQFNGIWDRWTHNNGPTHTPTHITARSPRTT